MKTLTKVALAGLAVTMLAAASPAFARGGWGHGPGGWGGGPGGCGGRDTPLTTAQVREIVEGRIAWRGEDLKVGTVEQKEGGAIVAEIVKPDGTVSHRVQVDPKTGRFRPAE